jgi:uncharacterized protein YkwD
MEHALALLAFLWMPRNQPQVHAAETRAATALYYDLNRERRLHGLTPLHLDSRLSSAASEHVIEMSDADYFDHLSLNGRSPFERMRDAGCIYTYAGENLAEAPSERVADSALFSSVPHRQNTLSANYRRVGIAVMFNDAGELLFVEDFTD